MVRQKLLALVLAVLLVAMSITPGIGVADPGSSDDPIPDPLPGSNPPKDEPTPPPGEGVHGDDDGTKVKIKDSNISKVKTINLLHNTWSYDSNVSEVQVNVTGDRVQLLIVHSDAGNVTLDLNFTYGKGKTFIKTKDKEKISYKTSDLNLTFTANTSALKEIIVVEKEKDKLFPLNWTVNVISEWGMTIERTNRTIRVGGVDVFWLQAFTATNVTNGTVALNETYSTGASSFNISLNLGTTIDKDDYPITIDPTVTIDVTAAQAIGTRCIAVNSTGVMYTAYYDGTRVEYQKSTDGGVTWGSATTVSTEASVAQTVMSIDSNDNLHFAWRMSTDNALHKCYWVGNSTWSSTTSLRSESGNWVALISDDSGNTYVFYVETSSGMMWRMWDGDSWSSENTLRADQGPDEQQPAAAISSNDTIHVVWQGSDGTDYGIYYSRSTDGSSFSTAVQIDADLGGGWNPSIAVDSNDDLHIIWQGKNASHTQTQAVYMMYDASASSWGSEVYLTNVTGTKHRTPTMAVDLKDDTLYAIWGDDGGSAANDQVVVRISTDGGSSWGAETQIIDRTGSSRHLNALHYAHPSNVGNIPYEGYMFAFVEDYGGTPDYTIYYSSDFLLWKVNPSWVDDSTSGVSTGKRPICRSPDGTLHMLAYDNTRVRHYTSTDEGYTWTPGSFLGTTTTFQPASIVATSNGDLWATLYWQGSTQMHYQKYTNSTSTWGTSTPLGTGNWGGNTVDSQDYVFFFYSYSSNLNIYYKYWDGSQMVSHTTWNGDGAYPTAYVDRFDRIHVIWSDTGSGNYGLVYQINDQHGLNEAWSAEEVVVPNGGPGYCQAPDIVVDTNGVPHVTYHVTGAPYLTYYTNRIGGSWSTPVVISLGDGGNHQYYSTITVDRNNTLHVAWYGGNAGGSTTQIRNATSHDFGTTWTLTNNITTTNQYQVPYSLGSYWPAGNLSIPSKGFALKFYDATDDEHLYYRSPDWSWNPGLEIPINDPATPTAVTPPHEDDTQYPTGSVWLSGTIAEPEGETFDVEFFKGDSAVGPWYSLGSNETVSNGTFWQEYTGVVAKITTYWWRINTEDASGLSLNWTYNFDTIGNWDHVINGTATEVLTSNGYLGSYRGVDNSGRQMNGTLWYFTNYRDPNDSTLRHLLGSYSSDNGTTWNNLTVWSYTDPDFQTGGYPGNVYDVQMLSNNSIVVLLFAVKYTQTVQSDVILLCHWNNSDLTQWEKVVAYTSPTYNASPCGMAANSTDKIMVTYYRSSHTYVHYDVFDPEDRSFDRHTKNNLIPYLGIFQPFVNSTDGWELTYAYNDGIGMDIYLRTADGTWTLILNSGAAGLGSITAMYDCVRLVDGTYVWTDGTGWDYYRYWNSTGLGVRRFSTTISSYTNIKMGVTNGSKVHFIGYDTADDTLKHWENDYFANNLSLWATITPVWEQADDTGSTYAGIMPRDIHPQMTDHITNLTNHTQLPLAEYFFGSVVEIDADDGNSYDHHILMENGITWPGVANWTYIPGAGPGPGPGPSPSPTPGPVVPDPSKVISFHIQHTFNGILFIPDLPTGMAPSGFSWDFGDGTASTAEEPFHYYREPGVYTVNLTVEVPYSGTITHFATVTVPEPSTLMIVLNAFELSPGVGLIIYIEGGHLTIPPLVLLFIGFLIIANAYYWSEGPVRGWRFAVVLLGGTFMLIALVASMEGGL